MDRRSLAALSAMGVSPMERFSQDFESGMKSGESLAGAVRGSLISERMGKMAAAVKDGGDLMNIDESLYADPIGMQALGQFQQHYLSTQKGMKESAELNRELAAQSAQEVYAGLQALEQYKDDPQATAAILTKLSKKLPLPYQAEPGNEPGTFNILYQDRGGNKPTGRTMTADEMIQTIKGAVGNDRKLMNQLGTYLLGNITRNMEYKQDPKLWMYTEGGQQLVPQKQMHNGAFEVGYIPIGTSQFLTQEEAQKQYGGLLTFDQYKDKRKMGQDDRQLDISQQNANTSLASVGVAQQNADTSRERLKWEMNGGRQKELSPAQLRQVEEKYTDTIMNDLGYTYKNRAYVKEETDEYGWVTRKTTAPASVVNKARADARVLVAQDYGKSSTGAVTGKEPPTPQLSDMTSDATGNRPAIFSFLQR